MLSSENAKVEFHFVCLYTPECLKTGLNKNDTKMGSRAKGFKKGPGDCRGILGQGTESPNAQIGPCIELVTCSGLYMPLPIFSWDRLQHPQRGPQGK